jgi:hypothetical protein
LKILYAVLLFLVLSVVPSHATTWYVLKTGGTSTQCDGTGTGSFPGGTGIQHCAFNSPYQMVAYSGTSWTSLVGSDTIQFLDYGGYYFGEQLNGLGTDWHSQIGGTCPVANADGANCVLPPLPNGTSGHPTRILGTSPSTCYTNEATCTLIYGINHIYFLFSMAAGQYLDIEGFDITQPDQCTFAGAGIGGFTDNCQVGTNNFATYGVAMAFTAGQGPSNSFFGNSWIHGIASRAFYGSHYNLFNTDTMTIQNVNFWGNGFAGMDTDSGNGGTTNESVGSIYITNVHGKWNGCIEVRPLINNVAGSAGWTDCMGQSNAGYGDCATFQATGGTWYVTDSSCDLSTQDGWDGLHIGDDPTNQPTIVFLRTEATGNMGQQFKMGGNASSHNGYFVGNCFRLTQPYTGNPSNYDTYTSPDACRAGNNAITFQLLNGDTDDFSDNTVVSYSTTTYNFVCAYGQTCSTGTVFLFRNNISLGFEDPNNSNILPSGFYYGTYADDPNTWIQSDPFANVGSIISHNSWYHTNSGAAGPGCPADSAYETNYLCVDPLLTNESSINPTTLDGVNPLTTSGSPVVGQGITISGIPTDYYQVARPNPPTIGATEPAVVTFPTARITGHAVIKGQGTIR